MLSNSPSGRIRAHSAQIGWAAWRRRYRAGEERMNARIDAGADVMADTSAKAVEAVRKVGHLSLMNYH